MMRGFAPRVTARGCTPNSGHSEMGKETFTIDPTRIEEMAFTGLARLGAPLARRVQVRATQGYIKAMVGHCGGDASVA